MIDWDSPTWGHPDTCVHVAENGSHAASSHGTEQVDDQ